MARRVDTEDYLSVLDLIGEYQWLVDEGDAEGWAGLFTEDGLFDGGAPGLEFSGREGLMAVPAWVRSQWQGGLRHLAGSLYLRYGATRDEVIARYYNLVTDWHAAEPRLFTCALSQMTLRRAGEDWTIASVRMRNLGHTPPPES